MVEMLTGGTPYKDENFDNGMAIIFQVGTGQINPLTSMKFRGCTALHKRVEHFLEKCFCWLVIHYVEGITIIAGQYNI